MSDLRHYESLGDDGAIPAQATKALLREYERETNILRAEMADPIGMGLFLGEGSVVSAD